MHDTNPDEPRNDSPPEDFGTTPPPAAPKPAFDARFSVPITIELDATSIPLQQLQALQQGGVLPVDAEAGTIRVRILASGKPFARGSLVSVGDGYGVLIEGE